MGAKDILTGKLLGNAQKFTDKQIAETLQMLVAHGVKRGASDIHIEPHENFVLIRYRIDGTLMGVHKLPKATLPAITTQLKVLADLSTEQTAAPQEGSYRVTAADKQVDVHLTTMPVIGGEKIVLHLSLERGKTPGLEALGFWGVSLAHLQTLLAHPHGLLLVVGPKHSGVSSTLFSMLQALNTPLLSIATVETHPTYRLVGVSQTYAANGMTTREALQATLKQDPNIIMLSDIPDAGTAELAVHATTNGHMVLAGMHAGGAIPAILRLRTANVEPFLVATGLRAAIGQRLVRTLCPDCRERYSLSTAEQHDLAKRFGITTGSAFKRVHELEQAIAPAIFGDVKQLNSTPTAITHLWRMHDGGCESCDHTGYKGRSAIVELLEHSDNLQKALLSHDFQSTAAIQAIAVKDGFVPMALDGLVKALRGQTTISEVLQAVTLDVA